MQPWKLNLIKAGIGAIIFGAWTFMVSSKIATPDLLQNALQSVFATVGVSHLLISDQDNRNVAVKLAAIAGTLAFLSYLVFAGFTSADVVVADFLMLLVAFGIVTPNTSNPKS